MRALSILALTVCSALAACSAPATLSLAQEKTADTMDLVRDKARADKKQFVEENLDLTGPEAATFWPLYERYQRALDANNIGLTNLIRDYGKNAKTLTDEAAARLVTEAVQLEVERANLAASYLPLFEKVLPGKKVARYYQIETKIRALFNFDLAKEIPLVQ